MPAGNDSTVCSRCEKPGHVFAGCYANFHINGTKLKSSKPAPVPELIAADRKERWLKQQVEAAQVRDKNEVGNLEYSEEMAMYREMVDRTRNSAGRAVPDDFDPEINTIEGNNIFELPSLSPSSGFLFSYGRI